MRRLCRERNTGARPLHHPPLGAFVFIECPAVPGPAENYNLTQPIRHVTNEKPMPMQWATIASEHPSALVDSCLTGLTVPTGPMTRRFVLTAAIANRNGRLIMTNHAVLLGV